MSEALNILFVEDVPTEVEIAVRHLQAGGLGCSWLRVDTEADFRSALREFAPHIVLSDFTLPAFDGMRALAIARECAPQTPFVFLSGTIGEERAIEALQHGAMDYVLKTNLSRLVPAVRRALDQAAAAAARRALEQQLHDVVHTVEDWIWELDARGDIVFCSESVQQILGHRAQALLGAPALELVHPEDRPQIERALAALGPEQPRVRGLVARWRHGDGGYRWLERHALVLLDAQGGVRGWRGADRDITQRVQNEARIARLTRVLRMLSGVNSAVVRIRARRELLEEACRLAVCAGGYASAMVALVEPGTRRARPFAWVGTDEALMGRLTFPIAESPAGDASVSARVLRTGRPFVCNDLGQLPASFETAAVLRDAGYQSIVALPLLVDGTTVGVLTLTGRERGAISRDEQSMLAEVAGNLSFALQYLHKESAVKFLSYFDPGTALAKRALFCERLERLLGRFAGRRDGPAIAVLDVEQLSAINDAFGRHAGDLLLGKIADRLKRHFEDGERLGYLGSGTFALIFELTDRRDDALAELQRHLAAVLARPFSVDGHEIPVAMRSGLARYPQNGGDAAALLQNAEAALRSARAAGEKYLHHRLEMNERQVARLTLEYRLRTALEQQQFELHYQPKVNVKTRRIEGVEALLRWRDPQAGLVSPGELLPVLEATGLIVPVGEWVLRRAALDCQQWVSAGLPPMRVAVNIAPQQLRRRGFESTFLEICAGWSTPLCGLDLEITEGLLLDDSPTVLRKLKVLRGQGVRIAVDDFGTGYSSLARLSELPIDVLKIDRLFTSRLPADAAGRTLVSTIIALGRAFEMTIVAEGVERQEQLELLWELGCHQSQGYLHSRPVPAAELAQLLLSGRGRLILPPEPPAEHDSGIPQRASGRR